MKVLSSREAARFLGISYYGFITDIVNSVPFVMVGKRKKFIEEELEAWLLKQRE